MTYDGRIGLEILISNGLPIDNSRFPNFCIFLSSTACFVSGKEDRVVDVTYIDGTSSLPLRSCALVISVGHAYKRSRKGPSTAIMG